MDQNEKNSKKGAADLEKVILKTSRPLTVRIQNHRGVRDVCPPAPILLWNGKPRARPLGGFKIPVYGEG